SGASIAVGSATLTPSGSLIVGDASSATGTGTLNASAASGFTANVNTVSVGTSSSTSITASGTLQLPANSTISAGTSFVVGNAGGAFNSTPSSVTTANSAGTTTI